MRALTSFGRQLILPNGIILLIALGVQRLGILNPSQQNVEIAVGITCAAALALAWRFNLPRMALALATTVLLMVGGYAAAALPGSIAECALALTAFAAPINLAFLLLIEDPNFDLESFGWWAGIVAIESLLIYAMSRSEAVEVAHWLRAPVANAGFLTALLSPIAVVTLLALAALTTNYVISRKAPDAALLWASLANALAFSARSGIEPVYFIAASLILGAGLLEGSYAVAYHDELTGLPGRRAYNRLARRLSGTYSIAVVDIDHFKKFNDTYGHDVGDQVLRMVAGKLAEVTGMGKAFRLGGEEFAIVFPFSAARDAAEHLEIMREEIELTPFMVRGPDRSRRERPERRREFDGRRASQEMTDTHVTVSMGIADSESADEPDEIMLCADRALYQAKDNGRNQVILFQPPARTEKKRRAPRVRPNSPEPETSSDRFR